MKKLIYAFVITAGFISNHASAQLIFDHAYALGNTGNDQGYSVVTDASGNTYCTGFITYWINANPLGSPYYIYSNGGEDAYIAKYNAQGIMDWAFCLGGTGDDAVLKLALDASGNVYATGRFLDTVDFDPGAGVTKRVSAGGYDIFLARYDNNGVFQWVNTFGGAKDDQGWSAAVDQSAGNVIFTGTYASLSMDMDPGSGTQIINNQGYAAFNTGNCFVGAYSLSSGAYQWAFNLGGYNGCTGTAITADNSGNVYLGGVVSGDSTDFDPGPGMYWVGSNGSGDKFLAKYTSGGALLWANSTGGPGGETSNAVVVDDAGYVYQGGYFNGFFNNDSVDFDPGPGTKWLRTNGVQDAYIVKFTPAGNLIWAFSYGGYSSEVAEDLAIDHSEHLFATGSWGDTVDFDPGPAVHDLYSPYLSDGYLAEYDSSGGFIDVIGISGSGFQFGIGVSTINSSTVVVTGFFSTDSIDFDPGAGTHYIYNTGGNQFISDAFVAAYNYGPVGIGGIAGDENSFILFPNPSSGDFKLEVSSSKSESADLVIEDVTGAVMMEEKILLKQGIQAINFTDPDLSKGVYLVELSAEGMNMTHKLVIQ